MADDPAVTRAKEQQRMVSQAEYTGKRKDSSSQIITQGKILVISIDTIIFLVSR